MSQNSGIGLTPFSYATGLQLAWATTTTLTVAAGQCRDSNNVVDMILDEAVTINGAANGANGLDTGDLANATWYYVFLISSSRNLQTTASIISTSSTPLLPTGYDSYLRIGFALTNGSAQFLKFFVYGNSTTRKYFWDVVPTELNAQGSATYAAIDLASSVPPTSTTVYLNWKLVPATAGNLTLLRPTGSTSTTNIQITGSVASQPNAGMLTMNCSAAQSIDYINASASDDLSIYVAGFEDLI
jgi:hypothetical protein